MGLLWDLIQQYQIGENSKASASDSASKGQEIGELRAELKRTQLALAHLIDLLEIRFNDDIDGDGQIGETVERHFPRYREMCPKCEFRFMWDGKKCGHCGYSSDAGNK